MRIWLNGVGKNRLPRLELDLSMETELYLGKNALRTNRNPVQGQQVTLDGEPFHRISNYDRMRPFFMTVVSDADHWLFISACREQCATSVWWRRQSKPATRSSNASAANIFRSPSVGDMATDALGTLKYYPHVLPQTINT